MLFAFLEIGTDVVMLSYWLIKKGVTNTYYYIYGDSSESNSELRQELKEIKEQIKKLNQQ